MLAGVGLAAAGVLRSGAAPAPPPDAVALVNGQPISRDALRQLEAEALARHPDRPVDTDERRQLLERAVDEELLLQRGLALGLARLEPTARRAIVSATVAAIGAEAGSQEPAESELRSFFAATAQRFAEPGGLRLTARFVAVGPGGRPEAAAWREASALAARLRSDASPAVAGEDPGDALPTPLPEAPLSPEQVRSLLGPAAAAAVDRLRAGEVASPLRVAGGYLVLRLDERLPPRTPPFEQVRERVRAEYLRTADERALARSLERLRAGAEIRVLAPELRGQ
jgi:hypothetical protein